LLSLGTFFSTKESTAVGRLDKVEKRFALPVAHGDTKMSTPTGRPPHGAEKNRKTQNKPV